MSASTPFSDCTTAMPPNPAPTTTIFFLPDDTSGTLIPLARPAAAHDMMPPYAPVQQRMVTASTPILIQADAVEAQPWRNGGGLTRELLRRPAGATDWQLRISLADV